MDVRQLAEAWQGMGQALQHPSWPARPVLERSEAKPLRLWLNVLTREAFSRSMSMSIGCARMPSSLAVFRPLPCKCLAPSIAYCPDRQSRKASGLHGIPIEAHLDEMQRPSVAGNGRCVCQV